MDSSDRRFEIGSFVPYGRRTEASTSMLSAPCVLDHPEPLLKLFVSPSPLETIHASLQTTSQL